MNTFTVQFQCCVYTSYGMCVRHSVFMHWATLPGVLADQRVLPELVTYYLFTGVIARRITLMFTYVFTYLLISILHSNVRLLYLLTIIG
jgi:hypothetical protein